MRFKVVGSNRQSGARVTMEIDGNSRAAAERQATQAGVDVLHVEPVAEETEEQPAPRATHRGEFVSESHPGRWIAVIVVIALAGALFIFWDRIRAVFSG